MATAISSRVKTRISIPYACIRNISSQEDQSNNRKILAGQVPISSVVGLPTNENVREYLVEAEGKLRSRPTQVHRAIKYTLQNEPENFTVLNSGIVIVTREAIVDDKAKTITLFKPSIINGSQTQGVISDLADELHECNLALPDVHVKVEIIVTEDEDLIASTSIARNFQNQVMPISIAGRLGQLNELQEALKNISPELKLRMSETQLSEDYLDTEKLIQVIIALTPSDLWPNETESENPNKVFCYSQKTKCLKIFQDVYKRAKDKGDPEHKKYFELYNFYLDIAPTALELYEKWKSHQGFRGTALRAIEREKREIVEVPDGIIFPILAALSAFIIKTNRKWKYSPPDVFKDSELIKAAADAYKEIADHNPQTMGKSRACYSYVHQISSIYKRFMN